MAKRKARTTVPAAATRESKRLRSSNADDNSLQILDARGRPVPQPPGKAWAGTAAGAFVGGKARLQRNAAGRSTGKGAAAVSVASPPAGQDSKNGERAVDRGAADEDAGDVQAPEDAARSGEVSGEEQGVEASGDDKMPGLRVLQHVLGLQGPVVVDENSRGQLPEDALNHEQAPARATTGEQPTFSLSDARQNGTPDIRRAEGRVEEAADPAAARSESENPTRTPDRDAQDDAQREKLMQVSASLITAQSRVHWLQDTLRRSEAALKRCQSLCGRVTQLCDDHGGEQSSRLVAVGRMRLAAFEARFGELGALERVLLQLIAAITPLVPRLMKQEVALEKGQRPGDVVGSDITLLLTEAQRNIDDAETLIDHILLAERSLVVEVIPSFLRMAKPNEEQQKRGASLTDHGIQRRLTVPDVQEGEILTFLETHGELGRNAALRAEANTVGTEAYYAGSTSTIAIKVSPLPAGQGVPSSIFSS